MATSEVDRRGIFDLHTSYKISTNRVLTWLRTHSPSKEDNSLASKTTTDYVRIAKRMRANQVTIPNLVIESLRDAISKRKETWTIYTRLTPKSCNPDINDANLKHKAFIEMLQQVLLILEPLRSWTPMENKDIVKPSGAYASPASNLFEILDATSEEEFKEDLRESFEEPGTNENQNETEELPSSTGTEAQSYQPYNSMFEDDDFGWYIEISFLIYEVESICYQLEQYFADVGRRKMSLPFAAWLLTTAYHAIGRRIKHASVDLSNVKTLFSRWFPFRMQSKIRFTDIPQLDTPFRRFTDGFVHRRWSQLLHQCKTMPEYREILSGALKPANARQFFLPLIEQDSTTGVDDARDFERANQDDLAMDAMLESMRQVLKSGRAIAMLEMSDDPQYISEPLLPLLHATLNDPSDHTPTQLVCGFEMILCTYRAFLLPDNVEHKTNCRVETLQLVQNINKAVSETLACLNAECGDSSKVHDQTISSLKYFNLCVEEFMKERRFDLYYQAPWTAGCHIVEILHVGLDFGLQLCLTQGYVGAVLHLYRALSVMHPRAANIPLLEQLCELFQNSIFLKILPTGNFQSHFRRAMGGNINRHHDSNQGPQKRFRIGRVASQTRPMTRITPGTSLFYDLHNDYYQTTSNFWARVYNDSKSQKSPRDNEAHVLSLVHSEPFSVALDKIRSATEHEFSGDLPVALINYFKVYVTCQQILRRLAAQFEKTGTISARLGYDIVDNILGQFDRHSEDSELRALIQWFRPFNFARNALSHLEQVSIADYRWDI